MYNSWKGIGLDIIVGFILLYITVFFGNELGGG